MLLQLFLRRSPVAALEKEMATHPSTLAWKIPWIEEPGRLQSIGSQSVEHDWTISKSSVAEAWIGTNDLQNMMLPIDFCKLVWNKVSCPITFKCVFLSLSQCPKFPKILTSHKYVEITIFCRAVPVIFRVFSEEICPGRCPIILGFCSYNFPQVYHSVEGPCSLCLFICSPNLKIPFHK